MLVACRLAGLSALEAQYAGLNGCAQCGVHRNGSSRLGAIFHSVAKRRIPAGSRAGRSTRTTYRA